MSSLRLALKQSLQETGHLFTKDKKKKSGSRNHGNKKSSSSSSGNVGGTNGNSGNGSSSKGRRPRQPGDPPRKRGRPRKHPLPDEDQQQQQKQQQQNPNSNQQQRSSSSLELSRSLSAESGAGGDGDENHHRHHHHRRGNHGHHSGSEGEDSESENEFSYDSEEEEDDSEEEGEEHEDDDDDDDGDDEEGEEHEDSHSHEDDEEEEEESGHPEDDDQVSMANDVVDKVAGPASPREHYDPSMKKKPRQAEDPEASDHDNDEEEERRRQKKLFKKHLQQAANKIQAQWKKKSGHSTSSRGEGDEEDEDDEGHNHGEDEGEAEDSDDGGGSSPMRNRETSPHSNSSTPTPTTANGGPRSDKKKKKGRGSGSSKSQTVPPPEIDVLEWNRSLSEKKSRRHVSSGMRVKVRFAAKVKRDGKVVKKKIWYGGRVSAVSKEGSKIRIKYDDGTSEISKFPDKDVVVDDTDNGKHQVPTDRFIPPERKEQQSNEDENHEDEVEEKPPMDVDDNAAGNGVGVGGDDSKPNAESVSVSEPVVETPAPVPPPKVLDFVVPTSKPDQSSPANEEQAMSLDEKAPEPVSAPASAPALAPAPVPPVSKEESTVEEGNAVTETMPAGKEKPTLVTKDPTSVALQPAPEPEATEPGEQVSTPHPKSTGTMNASAMEAAEVQPGDACRELGSPEEGEVSPGLVLTLRPKADSSPTTEISKPLSMEKDEVEPETSTPIELSTATEAPKAKKDVDAMAAEAPQEPTSAADKILEPVALPDDKTKDADKLAESSFKLNQAISSTPATTHSPESPTTPKRNLTIRISNAKMEQGARVKTPQAYHSDSEEELFADTPVTERKVKSIQIKRKAKRKRDAAEVTSSEDHPSKKRIHLKKGKPEEEMADLAMPNADDDTGDLPDEGATAETLSGPADPKHTEGHERKSNTTISISLRKPDAEVEAELLMLPKLKKKRERANSPVPKGRKSPVPRSRSPTPTADSGGAEKAPAEPESAAIGGGISVDPATVSPSRSKGVLSLPGGAAKGDDESIPETPSMEENSTGDNEIQSLSLSKGSAESLPSIRSGRRAAQQAKEKINTKSDENNKGPESMKKKKKRKRLQGEEDTAAAEHSDGSVDDRQWVQCDSCGKWRILPSQIKISSLPKHWYCHLNTYDPKRNTCTAPEQTAKQAAKDWRRARKRAKQQRLAEFQTPELEVAKEEPLVETKKELLPSSISPKPTKGVKKEKLESKRASPTGTDEIQPTHTESSSMPKEKKNKKIKQRPHQPPPEVVEPPPAPVLEADAPKKPGRKRGRPARNQTPQKENENNENVEWVQCEKCEKWRKLPPHISADELPDTWYCTMNTWKPENASCVTPEDKADSTHHEVGSFAGMFGAGAGKYSYRAMIFGNGKKHNRPMSERSRAAESLFMRPVDEVENPYPTVMYSKSSCFLPRTSNFNKANAIEDEKAPGIFDVLSNSELWAELSSIGQPMQVSSSNTAQPFPKFQSFENLPEDMKQAMRAIVLRSMGDGTLTAEGLMMEVQRHPWETYSPDLASIRGYFNTDIIVNSLLALVRDGVVEMTSIRNFSVPIDQWVPKYRKVRSLRAMKIEEAIKASRCMKISKPWKHREDKSDWVTGTSAFS